VWFAIELAIFLLILLGVSMTVYIAVVRKYYWAARGGPPPVGEERRRLRQEELRLRAKQIEQAKATPVRPRKPSFWDNTKS
jgi:hypothetical protein